MKNYLIVSTYPENGSQNIGDALITNETVRAIKDSKGEENVHADIIFRAEEQSKAKEKIDKADVIVLACFAIRKSMRNKYTFLKEIIDSKKPYAVLAAGTSLKVSKGNKQLYSGFSNEDLNLIKEVGKRAAFFSTRGYLTQRFCENLGIDNAEFSGDVAFYNYGFRSQKFWEKDLVNKIAVSDPHHYDQFQGMLEELIYNLKKDFPNSEIEILQHGKNDKLKNFGDINSIPVREIFKDKDNGLNCYQEFDLHAGFRVHGHVSALKRNVPSYLLEQDGRGADYGLTLPQNISFPAYSYHRINSTLRNRVLKKMAKLTSGKVKVKNRVFYDKMPAHFICTVIKEDFKNKFRKFNGLENSIDEYSDAILKKIDKLP